MYSVRDWWAAPKPQSTPRPVRKGNMRMPLVRIDGVGADNARLDALGRAVHDALTEAIGIPPEDRFQLLVGHEGASSALRYDDYLGVHRDHGIVYVSITMRSGRTAASTRNIQRRSMPWRMTPPTTGPRTGPLDPTTPMSPSRVRRGRGG